MDPNDPDASRLGVAVVIPATAAASRDGLELGLVSLDGSGGRRALLTTAGGGAARLELGPEKGFFVFSYGDGVLAPAGAAEGRAFVDAVARWLGLEADEGASADVLDAAAPSDGGASFKWVRLGDGSDAFGQRWEGLKLFLGGERSERDVADEGQADGDDGREDDDYAEVFLRLAKDGRRAQLVEKWSAYRGALVAWFERAVTEGPARRFRPRAAAEAQGDERLGFEVDGGFELRVPPGFRVARQPEGHHRITDPDDEMMIEISAERLPPLPPDAPDVEARLRGVIDESEHRGAASPVRRFERDQASFAWAEYAFDSRDTNRPEAAPRAARGRWLVGANPWVQVVVTGCWWVADADVAERAWDDVVSSIRLPTRVRTERTARGEA